MSTNVQIAETIRAQLGPGSLFMVGAKQLGAVERGLSMRIMRNEKSVTMIVIVLAADDTYTVQLWKGRGVHVRLDHEVEGVYADSLHDTLEAETGLAWRMPRVFHAKTGTRML